MSTVRSEPLINGQPIEPRAKSARSALWPVGVAALLFGGPLWLIGASYSLIGWILGLNLVSAAARLPFVLPQPRGWWILLFIPLGLLYSYVEVHHPSRTSVLRILVFVLIILSDLVTTYLSVTAADATTVSRWAAQTFWAAGIWTAILTFLPEYLILGGMKLMRRG